MRSLILCLVGLLAPAWAQPAPAGPTRDVTVEYIFRERVEAPPGRPGAATSVVRVYRTDTVVFRATPRAARLMVAMIDHIPTWSVAILDPATRTGTELAPGRREWRPAGPDELTFGLLFPRGPMTAGARSSVLGIACREWRGSVDGAAVTWCLTADGLVLRATLAEPAGAPLLMTARRLTEGPADPGLFVVPEGFARAGPP